MSRRTLCTKSGIPDLPDGKVAEEEETPVKKAVPEDVSGGDVNQKEAMLAQEAAPLDFPDKGNTPITGTTSIKHVERPSRCHASAA